MLLKTPIIVPFLTSLTVSDVVPDCVQVVDSAAVLELVQLAVFFALLKFAA